MKFAILSVAAAAALTLSAGDALAGPPGHHGHYHGGYGRSFHPIGPHLDYHRGHYHYHDGFYRSGPLVPVYPTYSYPLYGGYNSGFGLTITRPGIGIGIGSGVTPLYNYNYGYAPPIGGYGRRW